MCWSPIVSASLGSAGLLTAAYGVKRDDPKELTTLLVYFSIMEFLQFAGYSYLNQCSSEVNSAITLLSWIHIAFQPVLLNFYLMSTAKPISKAMRAFVYTSSFFISALMLIKIIPFVPQSLCSIGQTLCGPVMCTISGNWHLAWSVPQYSYPLPGDLFIYYSLGAFVLPLFYRAYSGTILLFLMGPCLAFILSGGNPLEWPAVWCFYSVVLIIYTLSVRHSEQGKQLFRVPRRNR